MPKLAFINVCGYNVPVHYRIGSLEIFQDSKPIIFISSLPHR